MSEYGLKAQKGGEPLLTLATDTRYPQMFGYKNQSDWAQIFFNQLSLA